MATNTYLCIDGHTCGCPVRVVAGGGPALQGNSMSERRQYFLKHFDWVRTALMYEPRGHDVMSGSILYPPTKPECDVGVLFIEVSGCLPMCGHGTIGTVTTAIEHGLVAPRDPPLTGASRKSTPRSAKARCNSCTIARELVVRSATTAPRAIPAMTPPGPRQT